MIECAICGHEFMPRTDRHRLCSLKCRKEWNRRIYGNDTLATHNDRNMIGAAGEMIVCADLLAVGFEVYRAVSPSQSCDIIAMACGEVWRIESRVSAVNRFNGRNARNRRGATEGKYDIIAFVLPDRSVSYETPDGLPVDIASLASPDGL